MIQVILPLASIKSFKDDTNYMFPLPLIDVKGKLLIEYVIENLKVINDDLKFIFIINEIDCNKYHLDNTIKQLAKEHQIIVLKNPTQGSICSILMAIDQIDINAETIIVNSDQYINIDYNKTLDKFRESKNDGGVIIFNSLHPRWSYAKIENDFVVETAEKNPISNNAIAGFYYFKKAGYFIDSAYRVILDDVNFENKYFTSSVFNQMILDNYNIGFNLIPSNNYFSFYTPDKIKEFESFISKIS
jgi:NDP-sugar pyrophosphorylase family protein